MFFFFFYRANNIQWNQTILLHVRLWDVSFYIREYSILFNYSNTIQRNVHECARKYMVFHFPFRLYNTQARLCMCFRICGRMFTEKCMRNHLWLKDYTIVYRLRVLFSKRRHTDEEVHPRQQHQRTWTLVHTPSPPTLNPNAIHTHPPTYKLLLYIDARASVHDTNAHAHAHDAQYWIIQAHRKTSNTAQARTGDRERPLDSGS